MNPGIYPNIPFETYHALDYASASRLKTLRKSPAHLKAELDGLVEKSSPALALGRAIHCAVLEPGDFPLRYVRAGQCAAQTGKGAQCKNMGIVLSNEEGWVCGVHMKGKTWNEERTSLSEADFATCVGIRESISAHPIASDLLGGDGVSELTLIWDDLETGVRCKARLDRHATGLSLIGDLKSAQDASAEGFARAIANNEYHIQDSFYLEGAARLGLDVDDFVFVAVEKEAPFAVGCYRIDSDMRKLAQGQLRARMRLYAECRDAGYWPAYASTIQLITLPNYSLARVRDEGALIGV